MNIKTMTNNNQPLKGLQGETIEQAAEKYAIDMQNGIVTDDALYIESMDVYLSVANWQSQHPAEKESATVDEMAERFKQMFMEKYTHDFVYIPLSGTIQLMQAAYNMRDKEQAGVMELIEARIAELKELTERSDGDFIKFALDELTTLLSQLTK